MLCVHDLYFCVHLFVHGRCVLVSFTCSFTETTMLINKWCVENDRATVRRSAVRSCEQRLNPTVTRSGKRPQGSLDPTSTWAICRFRWVTQLLIRLGKSDQVDLNALRDENGKLPPCFDESELDPIALSAIGWWDVSCCMF